MLTTGEARGWLHGSSLDHSYNFFHRLEIFKIKIGEGGLEKNHEDLMKKRVIHSPILQRGVWPFEIVLKGNKLALSDLYVSVATAIGKLFQIIAAFRERWLIKQRPASDEGSSAPGGGSLV